MQGRRILGGLEFCSTPWLVDYVAGAVSASLNSRDRSKLAVRGNERSDVALVDVVRVSLPRHAAPTCIDVWIFEIHFLREFAMLKGLRIIWNWGTCQRRNYLELQERLVMQHS